MSILGTANEVLGLGQGISNLIDPGKQAREQKKLNEHAALLNFEYGERSAENAYARQKEMYERSYKDESPLAKVQQLEDAGLSIGLAYSQPGGMGGSGTAATAPSGGGAGGQQGGRAPSATERQQAAIQQTALGMQMQKLESEVDLNKASAEKLRADALNAGADVATKDATRETTVEKMKAELDKIIEDGRGQWLTNIGTDYTYGRRKDNKSEYVQQHERYGSVWIDHNAIWGEEQVARLTKVWAEADNNQMMANLNNERTLGYWTELTNATKQADARGIEAAASKLAAEHKTGVFTNWRTWAEEAERFTKAATNAVGAIKGGKGGNTTETYDGEGVLKKITTTKKD